ncbi:SCO1-SenC domain-containing protein [Cephalotus follicularis]|uniref:SCO1-SenC domain-containing protein n=1 Tax=Cephalotus follicularis TaxID=3775 RepID=A0A1Q3D7W7_CEPFO|nr:SCO1-SenC domain-containing protein [Cephalotus follicularis]
MIIYRFLFFSSKHHPRQSLLQRFGPSQRIQSCSYAKSTKHSYRKSDVDPLMSIESPASRSWITYVIPASVLGFAGLAAFLHYNDEKRAVLKGSGQGNNCGCDTIKGPFIGGPFTLIDTENRYVTERDFLGNWILLYFGYTSSPDVGPEQLKIMAKAIDTLESKHSLKVLPVFVTLDPQRDTTSQLRAYLREFDTRVVGLTGASSAIRQMAQQYRVYFKKVEEEGNDYLVDTFHNMYLMSPKMEVVRCFGVEYSPEELSEAILTELRRTPA